MDTEHIIFNVILCIAATVGVLAIANLHRDRFLVSFLLFIIAVLLVVIAFAFAYIVCH